MLDPLAGAWELTPRPTALHLLALACHAQLRQDCHCCSRPCTRLHPLLHISMSRLAVVAGLRPGLRGMQAAEEMITFVQSRLQELLTPKPNAKQQEEMDRSRSMSVVKAEHEAHEKCAACLAILMLHSRIQQV